ncbi:MAG: hypothetical protein RIM99_14505 [Cyclobacteriaceae bacterium]
MKIKRNKFQKENTRKALENRSKQRTISTEEALKQLRENSKK